MAMSDIIRVAFASVTSGSVPSIALLTGMPEPAVHGIVMNFVHKTNELAVVGSECSFRLVSGAWPISFDSEGFSVEPMKKANNTPPPYAITGTNGAGALCTKLEERILTNLIPVKGKPILWYSLV